MEYRPGKHIIATLRTNNNQLLHYSAPFRQKIDELIQVYQLNRLGEVYHDFSPSGFTAVICLSESHISIHTWPEHHLVNIDIYLSNFNRNNDGTVTGIYDACRLFFEAEVTNEHTITR